MATSRDARTVNMQAEAFLNHERAAGKREEAGDEGLMAMDTNIEGHMGEVYTKKAGKGH